MRMMENILIDVLFFRQFVKKNVVKHCTFYELFYIIKDENVCKRKDEDDDTLY